MLGSASRFPRDLDRIYSSFTWACRSGSKVNTGGYFLFSSVDRAHDAQSNPSPHRFDVRDEVHDVTISLPSTSFGKPSIGSDIGTCKVRGRRFTSWSGLLLIGSRVTKNDRDGYLGPCPGRAKKDRPSETVMVGVG